MVETIVVGIFVVVVSGVILWMWKDYSGRVKKLEAEIENLRDMFRADISTALSEEKLRKILDEYFNHFELMLINEGRLRPRYQARKKSESGKS
jgi:Tfp pilus assembly protein PilO